MGKKKAKAVSGGGLKKLHWANGVYCGVLGKLRGRMVKEELAGARCIQFPAFQARLPVPDIPLSSLSISLVRGILCRSERSGGTTDSASPTALISASPPPRSTFVALFVLLSFFRHLEIRVVQGLVGWLTDWLTD